MMQSTENRPQKRVLVGSIATLVVIVVCFVAWRALAKREPAPQAALKIVASDKFKDLSKDQQETLIEHALKPTPEQEKAIRNMAMAHHQRLLEEYFALPDAKGRQSFLDKQIDEQEAMRKRIESPTTQPGEPRIMIKRGGPSAAAQKELTETVPAEYQAKLAQYMKDMKDRRAARGLPTEGGMIFRINR